jgi:hypothetical protein
VPGALISSGMASHVTRRRRPGLVDAIPRPEQPGDAARRVGLHPRRDVRVGVERDRCRGVAEHSRDDLRGDALEQRNGLIGAGRAVLMIGRRVDQCQITNTMRIIGSLRDDRAQRMPLFPKKSVNLVKLVKL